jgi:hypothetical protein
MRLVSDIAPLRISQDDADRSRDAQVLVVFLRVLVNRGMVKNGRDARSKLLS